MAIEVDELLRTSRGYVAPTLPPPDPEAASTSGDVIEFKLAKTDSLRGALKKLLARESAAWDRLRAVGLVLAWLDGLTFEEAALTLGVKPQRLAKWVRGLENVPSQKDERVHALAELLRNVHHVIQPHATSRWFHVQIPALNNLTPLEAIKAGKLDQLLDITRTYLDPSYR